MNKLWLQNIIYNSGDVFLPESVRTILLTEIIGSIKKTFYITWWSIIHFINGIIVGYLYLFFTPFHI